MLLLFDSKCPGTLTAFRFKQIQKITPCNTIKAKNHGKPSNTIISSTTFLPAPQQITLHQAGISTTLLLQSLVECAMQLSNTTTLDDLIHSKPMIQNLVQEQKKLVQKKELDVISKSSEFVFQKCQNLHHKYCLSPPILVHQSVISITQ